MSVLTIDQALEVALRQHNRGQLAEAEAIYRRILEQNPDHASALHLLGVLAHQAGNHAAGAALVQRAIALEPNVAAFHGNLGEILRAMGCADEAAASYQRAIALRPDFAEAYSNMGNLFRVRGQYEEAMGWYGRALAIKPDFVHAHINMGNALAEAGRVREAVEVFQQTVRLAPDNASVYVDLGNALTRMGDFERAVGAYDRAIELDPKIADAYCNVSNALGELGRNEEAVACCRRAIELNPNLAVAWSNLGHVLSNVERYDEAVAACHRAIALGGDSPEAYNNLGVALQKQERLEEAVAAYRRTLEIKPDFARAMNNLGEALKNLGQVAEGKAACGRAAQIDPNYAEAHWNYSLCLLVLGEMERGWGEYEWRLKWGEFPALNPPFKEPQWDGSDLDGRSILVHSEQGLGDTLQFIRYVPLIAERGGKVVVQCPPVLAEVVGSVRGIHRLVPYGQPLGEFDVQSHLLSLPHCMGTTLENIPAQVPYVRADGQRVQAWGRRMEAGSERRVGLVWAGSRLNKNDRNRSIGLDRLGPLGEVAGVTFYSLQVGEKRAEAAGLRMVDLTAEIKDFADTAALIENLDLVITVDTAVAHLAGAMGKTTWTLLPFAPDWRWLLGREDSPWYPTMRLFRQARRGDWEDVIGRVVEELKANKGKRARKGRKAR